MMRTKLFGLTLLLALLTTLPAAAQKSIEKYKANAMASGAGASIVELNIYRWSTDEERTAMIDAIKSASADPKMNSREVAKALRGQEKVGYGFLAGKQGYPLRYARENAVGGKRQIVLATDRPVSFGEVYAQTQLGDFDVTLIILTVDENGNGEGVLSLGTEVKWNEAEDRLEITNVSSQPVKLLNVRRVDK